MAEDASHKRIAPPRAASALLDFAVRGADMAPLLGDLYEEYADLAQRAPQKAASWYWRQTILSTAHVLVERARNENIHRALIALAGIFFFLQYWNLWVARGAAGQVYALMDTASYTPARITYFAVAVLGAGLAGFFFSRLTITKHIRAARFIATRAAPAALLVFSPVLVEMLSAGDGYPVLYRLSQTGLAAAFFIGGAALAFLSLRKP